MAMISYTWDLRNIDKSFNHINPKKPNSNHDELVHGFRGFLKGLQTQTLVDRRRHLSNHKGALALASS
jgi:hypothetical protein